MNTFEYSPVEALTINYLSYGVLTAINNVWAWIAVFTAAVSFWKIRANSVSDSATVENRHHHQTFLLPAPSMQASHNETSFPPCTVVAEVSSIPETAVAERPVFGSGECVIEGPTTRGKYTVYYGGAEEECGGGDCEVVDEEVVDSGMWRCEDGWETVVRMKMEGLGWYRYQDLTALDGSVVRMWDGCRHGGVGTTGQEVVSRHL